MEATTLLLSSEISFQVVLSIYSILIFRDRDSQVVEDLTINEHYRLLRVIHGRINLDPLYLGLSQFY